jgi:hypothetical protein
MPSGLLIPASLPGRLTVSALNNIAFEARYGSCSLTLREEQRLRVFENRVLRRIFGPKRDEETGEWRRLHNKELTDLYSWPDIFG